eukprot:scaffold24032_cov49-Attheya_sp.AAC.3
MTIKVEQDAVLYVLSRESAHPPSQPPSYHDNRGEPSEKDGNSLSSRAETVPCSWDNGTTALLIENDDSVGLVSRATVPNTYQDSLELEDDDDLTVLSTCSSVSGASSCSSDRRVTFSSSLVTCVRTRPRTMAEDVPSLFYTVEETQRFRQEYRAERKIQAELDADPATQSKDETDELWSSDAYSSFGGRHRISRVVVMHNDTLKTFFDDDMMMTPLPKEIPQKGAPEGMDFFDNDCFWSGSITWY